ncbi:MAG: alanine dehydrogenase [Chloroflexi bacterium]|nr:alanine dehydrogenase [Chloroflexota bacterium]
MIIGVPKEIKIKENRVALTPGGAHALVSAGHRVLVETRAGEGSGFTDEEYKLSGGEIVPSHADAWTRAEMVLKVKEPLDSEYELLRPDLLLFTYLHLAAEERLTRTLLEKRVWAVAYETVELSDGSLPLLTPMSEVAGKMSIQIAAHYLEKTNGGRGKLLGGVPGVRPADVVIIGGGTVGTAAASVALGMGADVTIIDVNIDRLRYLTETLHGKLTTLYSNPYNIAEAVKFADVVIGAVLIKGAKAPTLVRREMVKSMTPGSVIVDVAIDQGGSVETIHPTTHADPTYVIDNVIHYGVTNMPGAVPRTSTYALSNATLPYVRKLADLGFIRAVQANADLAQGVNAFAGEITYPAVAEAFGLKYRALTELI